MQLNESADIAILAELLVYFRYIHKNKIEKEMLFCKHLLTTKMGEDIFNEVTSCFSKKKNRLHGYMITVCRAGFVARA
jgi:hypothetical protein